MNTTRRIDDVPDDRSRSIVRPPSPDQVLVDGRVEVRVIDDVFHMSVESWSSTVVRTGTVVVLAVHFSRPCIGLSRALSSSARSSGGPDARFPLNRASATTWRAVTYGTLGRSGRQFLAHATASRAPAEGSSTCLPSRNRSARQRRKLGPIARRSA